MSCTERMVEYMTCWYGGRDPVVERHCLDLITLSILRLNFPLILSQYDATMNTPERYLSALSTGMIPLKLIVWP
jgi:hypothetical protein